jgi:periplasmic divalent cation tolerance protein
MLLVLTTFASKEKAEEVAWRLVQEELAACVNVLPGVHSIYRWKGEIEAESEVACFIKTTEAAFERLRARLVELHPYEVPEVVALTASSVHAPYLEWVTSVVR